MTEASFTCRQTLFDLVYILTCDSADVERTLAVLQSITYSTLYSRHCQRHLVTDTAQPLAVADVWHVTGRTVAYLCDAVQDVWSQTPPPSDQLLALADVWFLSNYLWRRQSSLLGGLSGTCDEAVSDRITSSCDRGQHGVFWAAGMSKPNAKECFAGM